MGQTTEKPNKAEETTAEKYSALIENARTLTLATVDEAQMPQASYVPFVRDGAGNYLVYVSDLSTHTANLLRSRKASLMIIEDEAQAAHLFARQRVNFDCSARELNRDTAEFEAAAAFMLERFPKVFPEMLEMLDFHFIELSPQRGRLVLGFGQAYDVGGEYMSEIKHVGGNGRGHTRAAK